MKDLLCILWASLGNKVNNWIWSLRRQSEAQQRVSSEKPTANVTPIPNIKSTEKNKVSKTKKKIL